MTEVSVILHVDGPEGRSDLPIKTGLTLIGRQPGNELVLDSPQVSRRHAQIEVKGDRVQITDLGSANGTRVAGEIIGQQLAFSLEKGAVIQIGPFKITVEIQEIETAQIFKEEQGKKEESPSATPLKQEEKTNEGVKAKTKKEAARVGGAGEPPQSIRSTQPTGDGETPKKPDVLPVLKSRFLINYLPGIYQNDFMERFLGLFESILLPIEWNIDNFDIFLDVDTSPIGFLSWLASWYGLTFDSTWTEAQQRQFLKEAVLLYARRGTRWSLTRMLEIYTGNKPEIVDQGETIKPFHFEVIFKYGIGTAQKALVESLIDSNKPAQSFYILKIG